MKLSTRCVGTLLGPEGTGDRDFGQDHQAYAERPTTLSVRSERFERYRPYFENCTVDASI